MESNITSNFLDRLGSDLVQNDLITESQFEEAMDEMERTGNHLGEVLTGLNFISEDKLNEFLAERLNIPRLNLDEYEADQELVYLIDKETAKKYMIIPLFAIEDVITVAMADPLNVFAIEKIKGITNKVIEPVMASKKSILKAINDLWDIEDNISRVVDAMDIKGESGEEREIEGEQVIDEAPIIKLAHSIIEEAIRENASDIHIEPEKNFLRIRYRVDGVLREVSTLEKKLQSSLATRIKVMSSLDIGQRRIPQDGKARFRVDGRNIDLRVSTYPVVYGEKVVLRILDTKNVMVDLGNLGLNAEILVKYRELVKSNSGIILVTGPTGSGKTTTLYSTLNEISGEQLNITTIEDPREYEMQGINQGQVDVKAGITFASALRSIVRQDPDIILVGEIRDLETAELAVRSALTGHLVFSTLYTPIQLPERLAECSIWELNLFYWLLQSGVFLGSALFAGSAVSVKSSKNLQMIS